MSAGTHCRRPPRRTPPRSKGCRPGAGPEGIAVDPATGDVFVGTFDFGPETNKLVRIGRNGRIEAIRDFGGTPLLGLGFARGLVYVLNYGTSSLQRLPADFDPTTPVERVAGFPSIGSPGSRAESNPDGSQDTVTFGSSGILDQPAGRGRAAPRARAAMGGRQPGG